MTAPDLDAVQNELLELAERCEVSGYDNSLDVQIEVAMFKPNTVYAHCRANAAGTKVIYTDHVGNEVTCWAEEWTCRPNTASRLRALSERKAPTT